MILACWQPQWRPRRSLVRKPRAVKSSIPMNGHGAKHASVAWPPLSFGRQISGQVFSLHVQYVLPFPSHVGLQLKVQQAVKEINHPGEPLWGSAHSIHVTPIHFRHLLQPGFQFSPRAHAGPMLLL